MSFLALGGEVSVHVDVEAVQSRRQTKNGASDRHLILASLRLRDGIFKLLSLQIRTLDSACMKPQIT